MGLKRSEQEVEVIFMTRSLPFPTFIGGEDINFAPEPLACFVCHRVHWFPSVRITC